MKKAIYILLLSFSSIALTAQSDITYKNFGEGWAIPINENVGVDMDENGTIDFYINEYYNELGFTPIFVKGCFASPGENAFTSFEARKLSVFEEGDPIQLNASNLYDYIDDGRGSGYSVSGGFADNFADQEDVYVGVALIVDHNSTVSASIIKNAWIKLALDATSQEMIIKEWAYAATDDIGYGDAILAGDTGDVTSVGKLNTISDLSISPNPAKDRVEITFDYTGKENLSVVIQNNVGQEVYRNSTAIPTGNSNLVIYTDNWTNGMYFVRFETETAIRMERLSVVK